MQIKDVVKKVIKLCTDEGIIVQLYKSKSSNTVYLRLDKGALGCIRISDHHKRSEDTRTRYSLVEGDTRRTETYKGNERNYGGFEDVSSIFRKILKDRYTLMMKHGRNYKEFMHYNSYHRTKENIGWLDRHIVQDKFFTRNKKAQLKISIALPRHKRYK